MSRAPSSPAPHVPQDATISTLVPADAVGTLTLADGSTLRFGASACRGFTPAVGVRVRVVSTRPHPLGGHAASTLELVSSARDYDDLVAARDRAAGVAREAHPDEAAHTSMQVGWMIVLFDHAVPARGAAFVQWAEELGLRRAGVRIEGPPMARLTLGGAAPLVYPGANAIPPKLLEGLAGLTPALAEARGFVGLSLGLPGNAPLLRMLAAGAQDPWGMGGRLRDLSRLAALLASRGLGVIVPQGHFAMTRDAFLRRLGDLDDATNRPFQAWVSLSREPETRRYRSVGMNALELFDVSCDATSEGALATERARHAVLTACHRMVRDAASLARDTILDVPIGGVISSAPLVLEGLDTEAYRVEETAEGLGLARVSSEGPAALWAAHGASITPSTYDALLRAAAEDWHRGTFHADLTLPSREGVPRVNVEVHRIGPGFVLHTVGAGRVVQPGGSREAGTAHVELVAAMAVDHPLLARVLGVVAQALHDHGPDRPYQFGDTVNLPVAEIGAAAFVLIDAGSLSLGAGEPISIMELVPITQAELDRCRREGSAPLRAEIGGISVASRAPRWAMRTS